MQYVYINREIQPENAAKFAAPKRDRFQCDRVSYVCILGSNLTRNMRVVSQARF
jgi:hypothetical protein